MILELVKLSHSPFDPQIARISPPLCFLSSSPALFLFSHSFPSGITFLPNCLSLCLVSLPPSLLTGGDDALQSDDIGVVKLPQDASLAEEGATLFVRAAGP